MFRIRNSVVLAAALLIAGSSLAIGADKVGPWIGLKARQIEPPPGTLPAGKIILVDDGTCPTGQIKLIIGGSNRVLGTNEPMPGAPRQQHCVER